MSSSHPLMESRICSLISASGTILGAHFERSIPHSPGGDPPYPQHPSDDHRDQMLFDTYIAGMVAKDRHHLMPGPASTTPTPTSSERPSTDDPSSSMEDSPSQATITQAAMRAETTKLKKKRSLGQALKSFKTSSKDFTDSWRGNRKVPFPLQLDDVSVMTVSSEHLQGSVGLRRTEDEDGFEDRNRTVRRRNMPHHPFRSEDAPYMQAYSQILLENDYQTHQLLCKLTRPESPTFHKFGKKPPADVLDLGCGEGFWVLHAAKLWKSSNTKVTGVDLIDVHNNDVGEVRPQPEPEQAYKNVTWLRANFVKHPLPFPDNSFDLVRMANLTLCIPVNRWKFVLSQVRRVLRPGGRLELIDDDLFFPSILPRPSRDVSRSPSKRQWQRTVSADNVFNLPHPRQLSSSLQDKALPALPTERSPDSKRGHARTPSDVEFSTNTAVAMHLETIFGNMLLTRYGIASRPHFFLEQVLHEVFGSEYARQTQALELALPSRELSESCENAAQADTSTKASAAFGHVKRSSEDEKRKPGWTSLDWERKEKRQGATSPVPVPLPTRSKRTSEESMNADPRILGALTPKARQLLFGEGDSVRRTPSWRSTGPYQPPGLVLLPSTLIPFSPVELEMHACKHMNTLLGCKYAISTYITSQKDPDGQPFFTEKDVDDFLWDYECFRRKRFNWPQTVPGLQMEDDSEPSVPSTPPAKSTIFKFPSGSPVAPESKRVFSADTTKLPPPMYGGVSANKQSSTHVRTIRVYEAMKIQHHHHCGCHCGGPC